MYKGTLSSYLDINFKYDIIIKELPFHMSRKIKNEAYVFTDISSKKIKIEMNSQGDILYCRANQAFLVLEIDNMKIKCNLKNVVLNKLENNEYELQYDFLQLN